MKQWKLYDIPYYDTFFPYLTDLGRKYEDRIAIAQFRRNGELTTHTYRQLSDDALGLARTLRDCGFAGSHLAIVGENSYDWLVAFLGVACAGCVAVTIDTEQPDSVIREMLKRADAVGAFASETFLPICAPLREDGSLRMLSSLAAEERMDSLHSMCEAGKKRNTPLGENLTPDTPTALVFTSGTTSAAKPVLLSQQNILVNATDSLRLADITQDLFTALPLYHTFGLNCTVLGTLLNGVRITLNGDLKTMLRDLQHSNSGILLAVPLVLEAIYKGLMRGVEEAGMTAKVSKLMRLNRFLRKLHLSVGRKSLLRIKEKGGLGSVNLCVCGGANLSRELSENLDILGIRVLQGYGITECSPLISVNCTHSSAIGSVGHVTPNCEVKIVDGEILARGKNVMLGYYHDPAQTAEAFDGEWFRTGDLGYMDRRGFLYITGRKKNLIVFKNGKKVSPEKLEEMISGIPMVGEVLVSGTTGGNATDDVKIAASICPDLRETAGMSSYEILEHLQKEIDELNKQIPPYQQIQMVSIRDTEFEKTSTKKIKRSTV
ncbi:MAG: AMP-binding protein [Oscillospiraceae bacterium]|nr:AMP-binding protein [Oscillospiraceae bacterium]